MAGSFKQTTDHDEIQHWIEEHDGVPAVIDNGMSRHLTILFPNYSTDTYTAEEIPLPEWFEKFDKGDMVLEYKEDVEEGEETKAFRLKEHE